MENRKLRSTLRLPWPSSSSKQRSSSSSKQPSSSASKQPSSSASTSSVEHEIQKKKKNRKEKSKSAPQLAAFEVQHQPPGAKVHQTRSQEHVRFNLPSSTDSCSDVEAGRIGAGASGGDSQRRFSRWSTFKKISRSIYRRLGLKHLFPALVVVIYTIIGAAIFQAIEYDDDLEERKQLVKELKQAKQHVILRMLEIAQDRSFPDLQSKYVQAELAFRHFQNVSKLEFTEHSMWDFWNAMYYCGTYV